MIPLPNLIAPFVGKGGRLLAPFIQYLQQFTQAPPNIADIIVGASPFNYVAQEPGNVSITGGTIGSISLSRGLLFIDVTGQKLIPVAIKDVISVSYTVLPTMKFLANYGQNTGQ